MRPSAADPVGRDSLVVGRGAPPVVAGSGACSTRTHRGPPGGCVDRQPGVSPAAPAAASPTERSRCALACESWVELRGLEPLTLSLRTRCATSCATAPGASYDAKRKASKGRSVRPNRSGADGFLAGAALAGDPSADAIGRLGLASQGRVGLGPTGGPDPGRVQVDGA